MKFPALIVFACAAAFVTGCVSQPPVTLLPVGPKWPEVAADRPQGVLLVYSALETGGAASDTEQSYHSAYTLRFEDGQAQRRIANRESTFSGEPQMVMLDPGRYSVAARASGHRHVIVPVVIEANKTTAVHLDGSEPLGSQRIARSDFVSFANGAIVGWRARETSETISAPINPAPSDASRK
jgi:hypothetical protein